MNNKHATRPIFTIVKTSANADVGLFQDPSPCGSFLSYQRAKNRLDELIAEEKENLNSCYDTENRDGTVWEMYEEGYAAGCFVRIEIVESEIEDWGAENE